MTRDEIIDYCTSEYNCEAVHAFKDYPDYVAIKHHNGKWFGLVMNVPQQRLKLSGDGELDILDLKVDPELNSILQEQDHFLPGYHMSKKNWISVILPQIESIDEIADLIEGSFQSTAK